MIVWPDHLTVWVEPTSVGDVNKSEGATARHIITVRVPLRGWSICPGYGCGIEYYRYLTDGPFHPVPNTSATHCTAECEAADAAWLAANGF